MAIEGTQNCKDNKNCIQNIITFKIFDECKIQDCELLGPVVSKEDSECIILSPFDESGNFGRIILSGQPITVPQYCVKAKIIKNSFRLSHIDFINIKRSPVKKGYWSVDIIYHFEFMLQFLDINMKPLKIVCCPTTFHEMKNDCNQKNSINAGITYTSHTLLYGGNIQPSQIFSDIAKNNQPLNNDPHIVIEVNAYPLDVTLKEPCCSEDNCFEEDTCCECEPICCDSYCEPFYYIYITIGLSGIIKLIRLISGVIHMTPCAEPPECDKCSGEPCEYFSEMEFPTELFNL